MGIKFRFIFLFFFDVFECLGSLSRTCLNDKWVQTPLITARARPMRARATSVRAGDQRARARPARLRLPPTAAVGPPRIWFTSCVVFLGRALIVHYGWSAGKSSANPPVHSGCTASGPVSVGRNGPLYRCWRCKTPSVLRKYATLSFTQLPKSA